MTTYKPVVIVDVIGDVVNKVSQAILSTLKSNASKTTGDTITAINYFYGHKIELIETLAQADNVGRGKYPLVWLVADFAEDKGQEPGIDVDSTLDIVIAYQTKNTYKSSERYAMTFKPVLYPIYAELLNQIAKHPSIHDDDIGNIPHSKYDRLYWGRVAVGGNDKNMVNDFCDAIELTKLQLKFDLITC